MAGRSVSGRWCVHATRIAQRLRHHDWLAALLDLLIVVSGMDRTAGQQLEPGSTGRPARASYLERILTDLQTATSGRTASGSCRAVRGTSA